MNVSTEFLFGVTIALVALAIAVYTMIRHPARTLNREEQLAHEVANLNATVDSLLARSTADQGRITALERALVDARGRIADLERELSWHQRNIGNGAKGKPAPIKKLLIVGGPDDNVLALDEAQLSGSGILYTRLRRATVDDVRAEFTRSRDDGRVYPWVLLSTHADDLGTEQVGGRMGNDEWMRYLTGASVVMLAACRTTALADHLGARIPFVAYFREDVPTGAASLFASKFLQRLNGGDSAEEAFRFALAAVPEVAPYVDYRKRVTP